MSKWIFERTSNWGGRFHVVMSQVGVSGRAINYIRGVPIQLESFSSADPFGDSTAVISFPMLTAYEDLKSDYLAWLADFSNVDIWWIPAQANKPTDWDTVTNNPYAADMLGWRDPVTNAVVYAPTWIYTVSGGNAVRGLHRGVKVWEGYIASTELRSDSSTSTLSVQCQGALFQLDRYLEKPFFPPRPQTLESLIEGVFNHKARPNLRTRPFKIIWPDGWSKVGPTYSKNSANIFTPNITPGRKWTGYSSRQTGSWDHSLTSFVQDQLSTMITQDNSGTTPGNQWTLMNEHQDPDPSQNKPGRTPVLRVRDRFAEPALELWLGTPGVEVSLSRDTTQMANIVYGDGTGLDGTVWRNAVISSDGSRTDYLPLAYDRSVFPPHDNKHFNRHKFVSESYVKFGTGFDQPAATVSAQKTLQRDLDPGWSGTITLSIDPSDTMSRFVIQAGTSVRLKGLLGSGEKGIILHIASVEMNGVDGTVTMQVDTRFRDLLNLEEAIARNRDPMTPAKLLQVNRASGKVEDVMAPWDYTAGSGFIPKQSRMMEMHKPNSVVFPYQSWTRSHPPHKYPHWYIRVNADAANSRNRWTSTAYPIMVSEKGNISHTEVCAYDRDGNVLKIPFHMSIYTLQVTWRRMPFGDDANGKVQYSPFIHGAFETINPDTGFEWSKGTDLAPDDSMIIGWGNYRNKAGYSPGRMTNGDQVTGKLLDDSNWSYDCTSNKDFNRYAKPGWSFQQEVKGVWTGLSVFAMFYCESTDTYPHGDVWFRGRLFHQSPGT